MEIYLVGGAVRDRLLGRAVRERDWVVVGSTEAAMRAAGYRQVGRDFPVFLHPETGDEYALARTERKVGAGHTGFVCHAGPEVTLEDDLGRRDLTVNAIAEAPDGTLIDPHHGARDLRERVLRHVSPAFAEDPLRVFRVARFAAQLPEFEVAAETLDLMRSMRGDLAELAAERVFQEFRKALGAPAPDRFRTVLLQCDCLGGWFPELADQPIATHPSHDPLAAFGLLGRTLHRSALATLGARLRVPNDYARLADLVARHGDTLIDWRNADPPALYAAAEAVRLRPGAAWQARVFETLAPLERDDARLADLALVFDGMVDPADTDRFIEAGLSGEALGAALRGARIRRLQTAQARA